MRHEEDRVSEYKGSVPARGVSSLSLISWNVHLNRWPWYMSAAWATLIGAALALPWPVLRQRWVDVALLVGVTDVFWGGWWEMATWHVARTREPARIPYLPYMRASSPWAFVQAHFPPGFLSAWAVVTALAFLVSARLGPRLLWMTFVVFVVAGFVWWLSWIEPGRLRWIRPLYGLVLPLWTGGYVFGREDGVLAGVAGAVLISAYVWEWAHAKLAEE